VEYIYIIENEHDELILESIDERGVKGTAMRIFETCSSPNDRLLLYLILKFRDIDWFRREFEEKIVFNYQFLLDKQKSSQAKEKDAIVVDESSNVVDGTLNS
jgi:hypothetical protein